jgi:signal transduction histidine kinase
MEQTPPPRKGPRPNLRSLKRAARNLALPRSTLRTWRFWLTIGIVGVLAILHVVLQPKVFTPETGSFFYLPIALYWIPVIYNAWTFGFSGGLLTAIWVLLASVPDFFVFDQIYYRGYELSQIALIVTIASFVGFLADQKKAQQEAAKLYAGHLTAAREEERRRISRDLHDNVLQQMALLCRRLDSIRYFSQGLNASTSAELLELRKAVEKVSEEIRAASKNLRPTVLDEIGPVNAIRQLLKELSARTGMETSFEIVGNETVFSPSSQAALFRITQEALRNVERHARASKTSVRMTFSDRDVQLEVEDNGTGLEGSVSANSQVKQGKFGLLGMSEHAEIAGGRVKVETAPGGGTLVRATIPI